jgi:hypothetical protein
MMVFDCDYDLMMMLFMKLIIELGYEVVSNKCYVLIMLLRELHDDAYYYLVLDVDVCD